MANRYREYLADRTELDSAIRRAAGSTEPLWDLVIVAHQLICRKDFQTALRIYDAVVHRRTLDLSAYCNALWVVQRDNTGLPVEAERSRRYLAASLPHAPMNPEIHLNAAGVLMELGDEDAAIEQLIRAGRRRVSLGPHLDEPLFEPLLAHDGWAEVEHLARPAPRFDALMLDNAGVDAERSERWDFEGPAFGAVNCAQIIEALRLALAHEHPHLRHDAARQAVFWRYENDDEDHMGYRYHQHPFHWHRDLSDAVAEGVPIRDLFAVVARDLKGPYAHEAARTFDILARGWFFGSGDELSAVAPALGALLRDGDDAVVFSITDGLFSMSFRDAAEADFRDHLVEPLGGLVETIAGEGSLSDASKVRRDQLRNAVTCLENLGALASHRDALERIVAGARGEIADRYEKERLQKLLAAL